MTKAIGTLNKKNVLKLLSLPLFYFLLMEYQVAQGFILGIISFAIFLEIQQYGLKALIFRPNKSVVQEVFNMIEADDLIGLKNLTKNIPPADLVKMTISG